MDNIAQIRSMYSGGNTCYGFHSFYDHMLPADTTTKIILKGGPGTGKSSFMKAIASAISQAGIDIECHWCSSDNNSLDGIVADRGQLGVVDGTAPHIVEPRYPGAVDRIINLGDFWDKSILITHKHNIINLSQQKKMCFERAYNRLQETRCAWREWSSYYSPSTNKKAIHRNILMLADDFLQAAPPSDLSPRHLFAAALAPEGIVSRIDSLLDNNWNIFAVKGSPGSGITDLFKYIEMMMQYKNIYGEIFHCPFDPAKLDLILLAEKKTALLDISGHVVDYEQYLTVRQYKRLLDFDQFIDKNVVISSTEQTAAARHRFQNGLQQAVAHIAAAKGFHHELENYYIEAMDFDRLEAFRADQIEKLLAQLVNSFS